MTSPKTSNRVTTRASNANKHPGAAEALKRKRRTKEEIAQDKAQKEKNRQASNLKKKAELDRIAAIEEKIAADDAESDQTKQRGRPLQRTDSPTTRSPTHSQSNSTSLEGDTDNRDTEYKETEGGATEESVDSISDDETPVKKKVKVTVRQTIDAARKERTRKRVQEVEMDEVEATPKPHGVVGGKRAKNGNDEPIEKL